jgi:hypothetical protein
MLNYTNCLVPTMDEFTIILLRLTIGCLNLDIYNLFEILDLWYMCCRGISFRSLFFKSAFKPQHLPFHYLIVYLYFPFPLRSRYYFWLFYFHQLIIFNSPVIALSPIRCLYEFNFFWFLLATFIEGSITLPMCQIVPNIRFAWQVNNQHCNSSFWFFFSMIPLWNQALVLLILLNYSGPP